MNKSNLQVAHTSHSLRMSYIYRVSSLKQLYIHLLAWLLVITLEVGKVGGFLEQSSHHDPIADILLPRMTKCNPTSSPHQQNKEVKTKYA